MTALTFHLLAGLVAGSIFRVQTLLVLTLVVLVEGTGFVILRGASAGVVVLLTSEAALQIGYLAGIYLRSILERVGIIVAAQPSQRS